MARLAYTDLKSYISKLRMTRNAILIVEGRTDKLAIECLVDELNTNYDRNIILVIDCVEHIKGEGRGSREKVEYICGSLPTQKGARRPVIGFVDREYRGFNESGEDTYCCHQTDGYLVRSRGHSIENYLFTSCVLRDGIRAVAFGDGFAAAMSIFEKILPDALRIAACLGKAGIEIGRIPLIESSINWKHFALNQNRLIFMQSEWGRSLCQRCSVSQDTVENLSHRYSLWMQRVGDSREHSIRWFCHGHIGLRVLWAAFAQCVFSVTGNEREAERVGNTELEKRFIACVHSWARSCSTSSDDAPLVIFDQLIDRPSTERQKGPD